MSHENKIWSDVFCAIQKNNLKAVYSMVEAGQIDVNAKQEETNTTILHMAMDYCRPDLVRYLIGKGADVNAVQRIDLPYGYMDTIYVSETPLDVGIRMKHMELIDNFKKWVNEKGITLMTHEEAVEWDAFKTNAAQMTSAELGDVLKENKKILQKLMITGELAQKIDSFSYLDSVSLYTKIRPEMNEEHRNVYENIIRNKRLEER